MSFPIPSREVFGIGSPIASNQQLEARVKTLEEAVAQLLAQNTLMSETILVLMDKVDEVQEEATDENG